MERLLFTVNLLQVQPQTLHLYSRRFGSQDFRTLAALIMQEPIQMAEASPVIDKIYEDVMTCVFYSAESVERKQ